MRIDTFQIFRIHFDLNGNHIDRFRFQQVVSGCLTIASVGLARPEIFIYDIQITINFHPVSRDFCTLININNLQIIIILRLFLLFLFLNLLFWSIVIIIIILVFVYGNRNPPPSIFLGDLQLRISLVPLRRLFVNICFQILKSR